MNKIKELRVKRKISQQKLAAALTVHQTAISQWETGRTTPDIEVAKAMAKLFGVSLEYLLDGTDTFEFNRGKGVRIPVIGESAAGLPISAIQRYIDNDDPDTWEEIAAEQAAGGEYVAVRIRGDSMEPTINNNDIVIVRHQSDVESGDTAMVIVNGDEATCKKIKKHSDGIMLISNNPKYEPMFFTNREIEELPVRILGKVIELRRKI